MGGSVDVVGVLADELHDVDFTAFGPADLADVDSEHPECVSHSLSVGELGPHLELAIGG